MAFTFSKIERLCSKKAIDDLFANGKSKTQFPFKLIYKKSEFESPFPIRAMFVVPKKKTNALIKETTLNAACVRFTVCINIHYTKRSKLKKLT